MISNYSQEQRPKFVGPGGDKFNRLIDKEKESRNPKTVLPQILTNKTKSKRNQRSRALTKRTHTKEASK
jgi:hypothetical protein